MLIFSSLRIRYEVGLRLGETQWPCLLHNTKEDVQTVTVNGMLDTTSADANPFDCEEPGHGVNGREKETRDIHGCVSLFGMPTGTASDTSTIVDHALFRASFAYYYTSLVSVRIHSQ